MFKFLVCLFLLVWFGMAFTIGVTITHFVIKYW